MTDPRIHKSPSRRCRARDVGKRVLQFALLALSCELILSALGGLRYLQEGGWSANQKWQGEATSNFSEVFHSVGAVDPRGCGSGSTLTAFGEGDLKKVLCTPLLRYGDETEKEPCVVISIGCYNQWDFEEEIVKGTSCVVHTFDCTEPEGAGWQVPPGLAGRVTLHPFCVGTAAQAAKDPKFLDWDGIVDRAGVAPGAGGPDVLKMDVEGFEYAVIPEVIRKHARRPRQIAVEIHCLWQCQVNRYGMHMLRGRSYNIPALARGLRSNGYRLVERNDNPFCRHCSEMTFVL